MRPLNLTNLVLQNSYIVIMALGMLLVIVAGHIDLSVGSVCGFIGALAAVLMVRVRLALRAGDASCAWSRAARSARRRAGSWPSSASRRSSSRWPACWCSRASTLALLAGPVGRALSRRPSSSSARASCPTRCGGETPAHHLAAARRAGRRRAGRLQAARRAPSWRAHGMESEPYVFFLGKNLFFAAADRAAELPAGDLQGPAQRADRDGGADRRLTTSSPTARPSAAASMRWAATRRRRGCRASRPSGWPS